MLATAGNNLKAEAIRHSPAAPSVRARHGESATGLALGARLLRLPHLVR
jgi:hypothetical protein